MYTVLLCALGAVHPALAQPDCTAERERQQQLTTEAMRAEMVLVIDTRRKLCPRVEAQAEQPEAEAHSSLDFDAYIRCRANSEALLKRTRPVLYTNRKSFIFYTVQGARLAREADALAAQCSGPNNTKRGDNTAKELINPAR
jgi:hypothetical protein